MLPNRDLPVIAVHSWLAGSPACTGRELDAGAERASLDMPASGRSEAQKDAGGLGGEGSQPGSTGAPSVGAAQGNDADSMAGGGGLPGVTTPSAADGSIAGEEDAGATPTNDA